MDLNKPEKLTFRVDHFLGATPLPRANSIQKHLKDLPITKKWLDLHAETAESYRLFRLQLAYQAALRGREKVKRWRLLRIANIRKELITPKIEKKIQELIYKGNNENL